MSYNKRALLLSFTVKPIMIRKPLCLKNDVLISINFMFFKTYVCNTTVNRFSVSQIFVIGGRKIVNYILGKSYARPSKYWAKGLE